MYGVCEGCDDFGELGPVMGAAGEELWCPACREFCAETCVHCTELLVDTEGPDHGDTHCPCCDQILCQRCREKGAVATCYESFRDVPGGITRG